MRLVEGLTVKRSALKRPKPVRSGKAFFWQSVGEIPASFQIGQGYKNRETTLVYRTSVGKAKTSNMGASSFTPKHHFHKSFCATTARAYSFSILWLVNWFFSTVPFLKGRGIKRVVLGQSRAMSGPVGVKPTRLE